jgi:hypothetical protein
MATQLNFACIAKNLDSTMLSPEKFGQKQSYGKLELKAANLPPAPVTRRISYYLYFVK